MKGATAPELTPSLLEDDTLSYECDQVGRLSDFSDVVLTKQLRPQVAFFLKLAKAYSEDPMLRHVQ